MKTWITGIGIAALLVIAPGWTQTAKQDMKNAGSDAKNAAKNTGKGVGHASKTSARKVKHKTKGAVHKTSQKVANKTGGK